MRPIVPRDYDPPPGSFGRFLVMLALLCLVALAVCGVVALLVMRHWFGGRP